MDILAGAPSFVTTETRLGPSWGDYPTTALRRVLINLEVLKQMGLTAESERLAKSWCTTYPSHAMSAFEADVTAVVGAAPCAARIQA